MDNSTSSAFEVRLRLIHETVLSEKKRELGRVETEVSSNESVGVIEGGAKAERTIEMVVPFSYPVTFTGKFQHIDVVYFILTEVSIKKAHPLT